VDILIQFGVGSGAYVFPQADQVSIDYNFANTLQQSIRVMGKDGGLSPYGTGRAPAEMGDLSVSYLLESDATQASDMGYRVSPLRGLPYTGVQRLFMRHRTGILMWTWAMCSNVDSSQSVGRRPHARQRVALNFQCMDSKWYTSDGMLFFNDLQTFGDGLTLPPLKLDQEAVQVGNTVSVTNYGNTPVSPYIRWDIPSGVTATNPALQWKNASGQTVYGVTYSDSLSGGDIVTIDCAAQTVSPTFGNLSITHGAWMEIPPGTHTLYVQGQNTFSDDILLTVDFWDTWV
jgi:hypothetical protein